MKNGMKPATVLLSGGLDSAACAHFLLTQGYSVRGAFIDFGQASSHMERQAAQAVAEHMGFALTSYEIKGTRARSTGELVGRNAFLITSVFFLSPRPLGLLGIGIHAGTRYFDCSPAFFEPMAKLIAEHSDGTESLIAPFLNWTKADIHNYYLSSELPLSITYSCEAGSDPPCGRCASCQDRRVLGC